MDGTLRRNEAIGLAVWFLIALAAVAARAQADLESSPFTATRTLVSTTSTIITAQNFLDPVVFTATIIANSPGTLLGPSSGSVEFTVGGDNAFAYVPATLLGSAAVSRTGVSGLASLTMKRSLYGVTLLPGSYNVTATFSGSKDGQYTPSVGYTYFRIDVSSPPVIWGL